MCLTPAASTRCQVSCDSAASRPSGFSQITCLPASAAAIVGSECRLFGPTLSNSPTRSSATIACQSVTCSANPKRCAASDTASSFRPAIETSWGMSGGGQVM